MTIDIESIGIEFRTDSIARGIKSLDELASRGAPVERAMQGVEKAAAGAGKSVGALGQGNASAGVEKVGAAGERAAQGLGKMGQAAQSAVSSQAALSRAVDGFTQTERKYIQSLMDEYNALDQTRAAKAAYIAQQKGMSQAAQDVARAVGGKIEAYKAEQQELAKLGNASRDTSESLASLARTGIQAFLGSALLKATKDVGMAMFEASAQAERFRTTLNFAAGGRGAQEIDYLRRVTGELGLQFASTAQAYSGFQAAARGTALEGQKAKDVFESVAKASAVMGLSAEQNSGVLLALQQMLSKGTVQAEELRGQLAERLPNSLQIAAKAMGVTTAELGKMLEQGQVVASDFLPKFARALNDTLGGEAEKAADRLDAAVNRFSNAWERLKQAGGDSGVSRAMANEMNALTRDVSAVTETMENAAKSGQSMFAQLASAAAVGAGRMAFSTLNLAANTLNGTINALTGDILGLNTKMAILPDAFKTNAEQALIMGREVEAAQAKLKRLQELDAMPANGNYFKSAIAQTQAYIAKLQEAIRLRDAAGGEKSDPRDIPATMTRGASYSRWAQEQKESEQKMLEIRMRQSGVNKQYLQELKDLEQALARQVIKQDEYIQRVSALATTTWDASVAGKAAAKTSSERASAAKAEQSAYDKLIASIQTKLAQNEAEIAGGAKLTDAEKLRIQLTKELEQGSRKMSAARVAEAQAQLALLDASEKSLAVYRAQQKFEQERDKAIQAAAGEIAKINEKAQALEDEAAAYGKTESELQALAIARLEDQKAMLTEFDSTAADEEIAKINERIAALTRLGLARNVAADQKLGSRVDEIVRAAEAEAAAYQDELRLAGLTAVERAKIVAERKIELEYAKEIAKVDDSGASDAAKEAAKAKLRAAERQAKETAGAKAVADEWQKTADQINQSLTDALMRGFESGKDFAKNMRDTVVNMFKTMVLRPIISAIIMPVAGALTGAFGLAGSANAGQGGMGGIGTIASIGSMFGGSLMAGAGWLTGATSFGGALTAGGSLLGTGFAGTMSGIGMLGGALLPLILGASLLGSFDKSGTPHYGASATYEGGKVSGDEASFRANRGISGRYSANAQSGVNAMAMGAGATLDAIDRLFGGKGGFGVTTAYSDDSSDDPGFGSLRITRDGQKVVDWGDTRTSKWADKIFADGEEGARMYAAAVAKDVRDAMLDIDLPEWARNLLTDIGDNVSMEQLSQVVQQIGVIKDTFDALGATLTGFAELTDGARMAILDAAGSIEALAANAGTYYQNFYSDEERTDIAKKKVQERMSELGIDIDLSDPKAREKYRKMVDDAMAQANVEEANRATLTASMTTELAGLDGGITGGMIADILGPNVAATEEQLGDIAAAFGQLDTASMSVEDLQKAVGDLIAPVLGAGKSASETVAAMLELSGAFAEVTMSAEDVKRAEEEAAKRKEEEAKRAQKEAYDTLRRAIDRDRKDLQAQASSLSETISGISSAVDLLKSNARDLYGEVDSTQQMLAAQGMVYIEDALAGVRAGASVADYTGLSDAISAARGGIDSGAYQSEFERQRDVLVLAGQLSDLGELGDMQLSVEERQLRVINEQLEYLDKLAQKADELINGTVALTETVDTYFARLMALLEPEDTKDGSGSSGGGGSRGSGDGFVVGGGSSGGSKAPAAGPGKRSADGRYYIENYYGPYGSNYVEATDDQQKRLEEVDGKWRGWSDAANGDIGKFYETARDNGVTMQELAAIWGYNYEDVVKSGAANGIPAFDVGTNYVPRDMLAQIHEGEAIVPKAFNPWANGQAMNSGDPELLAEMRAMRAELAALRAAASATATNTAAMPQMADQFDTVTNGGNAMRAKALA